ncbi:MAG: type II toxin-antitoxin system CcdA family antitoxin [Burkholderiaceae bacterium]|nr:type II toxin-antitoxin system CcdA family antitoxin [Burkholderiaceae bacterium]
MLRFDDSPKRPTNLSLNAKVLEMARELGMNLSQTVDTLLAEEVRKRYFERWNAENAEAIAHYNARIERDGTLSQRIRKHLAADTESKVLPR